MAVGLGLAVFGLYLRTLAPGLLSGDSGELQVLAYLLGHTHQTGYPIYVLLAKVVTWLPVGEIAYRVNLYSAIAGALAVVASYFAARALGGRRMPALIVASALAVSTTFWSQAVIAEVYTTAMLVLALVVLVLFRWAATGRAWLLFAAGLLGGLSLGVHLSVALFAPAAILYLALQPARSRRAWVAATLGSALGVALMLLAHLAMDRWGSAANIFDAGIIASASSWDLTAEDLDSPWEKLVFGLSGRQFQPFMFSRPGEVMLAQARGYFANLPRELSWVVIVGAALALVRLPRRRWRAAVLLGSGLLLQWVFFFNYEIWDIYVFYLPSYLLVLCLAAWGLTEIQTLLDRRLPRPARAVVLGALLLAAVAPNLYRHREIVRTGIPWFHLATYPIDKLTLETLHPAARASVRAFEPNSLVFTNYPWTWALYYVAYVEEGRTDLTFLETLPRDDRRELADSAIALVDESLATRPVFFEKRNHKLVAAGYALEPVIIGWKRFYRVHKTGETAPSAPDAEP